MDTFTKHKQVKEVGSVLSAAGLRLFALRR